MQKETTLLGQQHNLVPILALHLVFGTIYGGMITNKNQMVWGLIKQSGHNMAGLLSLPLWQMLKDEIVAQSSATELSTARSCSLTVTRHPLAWQQIPNRASATKCYFNLISWSGNIIHIRYYSLVFCCRNVKTKPGLMQQTAWLTTC